MLLELRQVDLSPLSTGPGYPKPEFGIRTRHLLAVWGAVVREEAALIQAVLPPAALQSYSDDENVVAAMCKQPIALVVAPLSGHHATLLRAPCTRCSPMTTCTSRTGQMRDRCPFRRAVLAQRLRTYVRTFMDHLGAARLHVLAVCQPTVPVLAAVALMQAKVSRPHAASP